MATTLIEQKPTFTKKVENTKDKLSIAEMFCDTLQGEGVSSGIVSTFMRMQGCTLKCKWCDTLDVWPEGNEYSFDDIFQMFENYHLVEKFKKGQHLVLTGGSPLMQQDKLFDFIISFVEKYGFRPYIEVENECMLIPTERFESVVDQWNNSPKTTNSGMKERVRYKPDVLLHMSALDNSWFKFVISSHSCWDEIQRDYIDTGLIRRNQIILMPEGQSQVELEEKREFVAELAIQEQVRFTDRMHITLWNKKTGV